MYKGVAVLVNFKEVIIGDSNLHSDTVQDKDNYLALNVIYDDTKKAGYRIEPNTYYSKEVIEHYHKKQFFLNGKPNPKLMAKARKSIRENEAKIFRLLCKNMDGAIIEENQWNNSATIRGSQLNEAVIIYEDQWNDSTNINKDQWNNSITIKGDQWNDSGIIKRNQWNGTMVIYGNQWNGFTTIKGNQWNGFTTIEGDIIIYKMVNGSPETRKLIMEFSKQHNNWKEATFDNFVKWLLKKKKEGDQ